MKTWLWLSGILFGVFSLGAAAEEQRKYYIQFVQGTDEEKPPGPGAKAIGPKLSQKLSSVFRWKHYWELGRHEITMEGTRVRTVPLNAVRTLEIESVNESQIELRLYRERHLVRKSRHPSRGKIMFIMGGDQNPDNAWFVVLRGDKPG